MFDELQTGLADWWSTLTPEFAFLLALPFVVGAVGLLGDWVRKRRREPRARPVHRRHVPWHSHATPRVKRH